LTKAPLLDGLIKELLNKSFEEACDEIPELVRQIFQESTQVNQRYGQFKKILMRLLQQNHGSGKKSGKSEQSFLIDETICSDERRAEFWLFEVIDEMFKRKGIQTCPHLSKVFSYVDDNINNEISLNSASSHAGLSISYLSRVFKKRLGTNFAKYVSLKKIKRSKQILKYSEMTINDIAFELGYNEVNYFCKVFKKTEHITPSQYREAIRSSV
jgi:YesN/AraC family two-component response regulator